VVHEALQVLAAGEPRLLGLDATGDGMGAGQMCGGRIEVLVLPVGHRTRCLDLLQRVLCLRAEGRPAALVTDLVTGLQSLVCESLVQGGFGLEGPELAAVMGLLAEGRCAEVAFGEDGRLFVQVYGGGPD
jgi:xanthine/CO dehydrogenase XdhC/CoxF family maturation factor